MDPRYVSPAEWDATLNTSDDPAALAELFAGLETPLHARRYLAAINATRNARAAAQALAAVEAMYPNEPALTGIRWIVLGQAARYEMIVSAPMPDPPAVTVFALEDSCDMAYGRGIAARALRRSMEAHAMLSIALFLAKTLGMQHREQIIMLELGQLAAQRGERSLEMIEAAMSMPIPTTARRRWYGTLVLAEACMAVGDYQRAHELLTVTDGLPTGMWGFTGALLGREITRGVAGEDDAYRPLAEALWGLRDGGAITMPPLPPDSPEAEYAAIIRAVAMLRSPATRRQGRRLLDGLDAVLPDQAVLRLAGQIHAAALDLGEEDVGQMTLAFRQALDRLETREFVVPLLRALMPEAFMLLALLPNAHPEIEDGLTELPILTGEKLTYQFTQTKLPGRATGALLLVQIAATGKGKEQHRQSRARIYEVLEEMGHTQTLNLGVALAALNRLRLAAPQADQEMWLTALRRALNWVDSDVLRREIATAYELK
ncbi:hypothetical protein GCM10017784_35380 [Deinococcus indicus]|uniref:hypothetical protein n=1 Tax=Deinococcus indicus TaxID=223556 RepID=UPI00174A27D1|nr:hypothetical protein [Deinococcus indicus]GHG37823.1 hypothetical protein GCM10017784_35380 [Deinococcus indicus]